MIDSYPGEWVDAFLPNICTPKQWKTISTKELTEDGYVVYGANGTIGFYSTYTHEKPTLMITCRGASCGNLHISVPYAYINGNAMALDNLPEELIQQKYLFYALKARGLDDAISGSAQPQITQQGLAEVNLPIAAFAEQHQIAAKLDELLAQVDSIKTRLDVIPKILKRFRQSVLAAAVSGKLTEEWRNSEELVSWKQQLLENLVKKPNYGTSSKSQKEGKVPVLRMGNLQNGKLDWNDLVYTSEEKEIRKYRLYSGDVLFNRTNSPELVGKTSIYRGEREAIFAGYLIRVQCSKDLNPEFLNIHLNSPLAREYCQSVKSDGVSQSNINAQKLLAYPIHCPPISEQTEIVRRVEQLFAYADQIEQRVKDTQARVNHLTQAILAKAFRGELTADWRVKNPDLISGENSAEALLKRIQLERNALVTGKATKVKKKSSETMTPKQIIPVYEVLQAAGKPLSGQELLASAGYPSDASTQQLEQFFLHIRHQLELKTITRNRRDNSDQDWFELSNSEG